MRAGRWGHTSHARLVRRTRWSIAVRGAAVVAAVLGVLSAIAYLAARQTLFEQLHERLEAAAVHSAEAGTAHDGRDVLPAGSVLSSAEIAALLAHQDEREFRVVQAPGYGALAVLRGGSGRSGLLVLPAQDELQALRTFLRVLAALTLAGGLAAVPAGYILAGQALRPLEEAVRRRTEFVALASHRLRTPVAVIRTSAELALAGQGVEEAEALQTIVGQTARLEELTARLTALSKAEFGRRTHGEADLSEVAGDAVRALAPQAQRGRTRVALSAGAPVRVRWAAPEVLDMAVSVLENAVRCAAGGHVDIEVRVEGRTGVLEVRDDGPGIDPRDLARVGEPFFQGRRAPGATGLGLAIARATAARAGGRIEVVSGTDRGTTVRVRLPLAHDRRGDAAPEQLGRRAAEAR